jgi:LDH2 family malate/lactate/ureidoglycolate dehydrogenase
MNRAGAGRLRRGRRGTGEVNMGAEVLCFWAERVLRAAGLEAEGAAVVADHLVCAGLRGVDSHGVARLPVYVAR